MYAYAQWKVFFFKKKDLKQKGWLEYYLDFRFFFSCALSFSFVVYVCCCCVNRQIFKNVRIHIEGERELLSNAHTAGKKYENRKCVVFTFPFHFRNYFYVSSVCVCVFIFTMVGTPCARKFFFSSPYSSFFLSFFGRHRHHRDIASATARIYWCASVCVFCLLFVHTKWLFHLLL